MRRRSVHDNETGAETRALHTASAVAVVAAAGALATVPAPWHAYALLAGAVGWYAVWVVPSLCGGPAHRDDLLALLYLAGATAWVGTTGVVSPFAGVLLIVLYTHAFWLIDRLWLATVVIAVATAVTGIAVARHFADSQVTDATIVSVCVSTFVLGNLIGLLVRRQADQQRQRDQLIKDLKDTKAELVAAHRREGARVERERMAREIHDTLAQGFTSIVMLIQAADAAVESDPELTHHQLALAERTARENLAEARALVNAERPAGLERSDVGEVIRRLANQLCDVADLDCAVRIDPLGRKLSVNEEVTIVRATQEALSNVGKHAGATEVVVTLGADGDGTRLEIADNGRGFRTDERPGFGLAGMRARVEEVGGTMVIESAPGAGTRLLVTLP